MSRRCEHLSFIQYQQQRSVGSIEATQQLRERRACYAGILGQLGFKGSWYACVDKALHQMGAQLLVRNCALPGTIARLVASILDVDRSARKFEKLRRCRVDELACLTLDLFLDTFREPARSRVTARERSQVSGCA